MTKRTQEQFDAFKQRIDKDLMTHRVITNNEYCNWFEQGGLKQEDVRYFVQQFSVFSNLFLIAQLKKMINAVDLDEMHQAKEILANEIGCIFRPKDKESESSLAHRAANSEVEGDPELVNTEGTVDGAIFRFKAAHFEWILKCGQALGLEFKDMGKRSHGAPSTLFFCDELERIYGNENFNISAGASFAVENWAAAGFWDQLVNGFKLFRDEQAVSLPIGFWTWHAKVEAQHKAHTEEELEDLYFGPYDFSEDAFIASGQEMLDGVAAFWDGLQQDRLQGKSVESCQIN